MMNRFNNLLIGVLWLLAMTLGATFWFNTMFGFNIFSGAHWQHLAYMQATGQTVKPTFYISIVVIAFIAVFGLYKLLQPRFRQITMSTTDRPVPTQENRTVITPQKIGIAPQVTAPVQPVQQPITIDPAPQQQASTEPPAPVAPMPTAPQLARPPRLNIPTITRVAPTPHVPLTPAPQANPETEYADIRNMFETAGYIYKGAPKIKGVQTAVVAIGTNEVLWIGAVGVNNTDMERAVQTLSGVFSDTLDDIEININAFVIGAPDASTAPSDILQFANTEDLRNYITGKPNTLPDADESENFDAYSGYIGTVMDYIGKI